MNPVQIIAFQTIQHWMDKTALVQWAHDAPHDEKFRLMWQILNTIFGFPCDLLALHELKFNRNSSAPRNC
jgi:hypothetical protein